MKNILDLIPHEDPMNRIMEKVDLLITIPSILK